MKTASAILISIGLFCFAVFAQVGTISRQVLVNTNGVVTYPSNLWAANSNGIVAVTGTGGGGSGTVTSVGATSTVSGLGFSGSPVTTSGTLSLTGIVAVASGGTGASTASAARTALGLVIGTDVQAWDADLDDLVDGSLSGSKVGTGISGDNITSGTVADARIASTLARDSEVAAGYQPLDADLTALAAGTAIPTAGTNAVSWGAPALYVGTTNVAAALASAGGGGTSVSVTNTTVTTPNFNTNFHGRFSATSSNVVLLPQLAQSTTTASFTPDFSKGYLHEVTLTNNLTLNAPTGTDAAMVGQSFRLTFIQDTTGSRLLSTISTNYMFGRTLTGITLTTNAGSRDYVAMVVRRVTPDVIIDVLGMSDGFAK